MTPFDMTTAPGSAAPMRSTRLLIFAILLLLALGSRPAMACTCSSPPVGCVVDSNNTVPVTSCGAVGDAVTDDCSAIQCAIDAIPSVGGTVFFPPGRYLIDDSLEIRSGVTLEGIGQGATNQVALSKSTILAGSGLTNLPMVKTPTGTGNTRIKIARLNFDGNQQTLPWALDLVNFLGSRIEEVRIEGIVGGGIHIWAEQDQVAWTNWIRDCKIGVSEEALLMEGSDSFIGGLYISGGKGIVNAKGGNLYTNCHVDRSTQSGLTFVRPSTDSFHVSVTNCYFDLNAEYGVSFGFQSPAVNAYVTVSDSTFRANTKGDVYLGNAHNVSVIVNTFNSPAPQNLSGMNVHWLGDVNDISVIGNQVHAGIKSFPNGSSVLGNSGYKNRASGTSTVSSGQSSLVVSHGMDVTPDQVLLQPTGNTSLAYWVSATTATTFTISLSGATASSLGFHWIAMTDDGL